MGVHSFTLSCTNFGKTKSATVAYSIEKPQFNSNAVYVTLDGDAPPGKEVFSTINEAISYIKGEDISERTIYVKAGNYGSENVVIDGVKGTQADPIIIEGYREYPGDNPTYKNFNHANVTEAHDAYVMPYLMGADRTDGDAIHIENSEYITIRNFQISHYLAGVVGTKVNNIVIDNFYVTQLGDTAKNSYSGKGIAFASTTGNNEEHHNEIRNSVVVNSAAEGIHISGDNNIVDNVAVYSNDKQSLEAVTDYYIIVSRGNDNTISNSRAERSAVYDDELDPNRGNYHTGHGFTIKYAGTRNKILNNVTVNIGSGGYTCWFRGVTNNIFTNNEHFGGSRAFLVRDGASQCEFSGGKIIGAKYAISFVDTIADGDTIIVDDKGNDDPTDDEVILAPERDNSSGKGNIFKDVEITDTKTAIVAFEGYSDFDCATLSSDSCKLWGFKNAKASDNVFENLTISSSEGLETNYMFMISHVPENNKLILSEVKNVANYAACTTPFDTMELGENYGVYIPEPGGADENSNTELPAWDTSICDPQGKFPN